jgi:hypothetical protein
MHSMMSRTLVATIVADRQRAAAVRRRPLPRPPRPPGRPRRHAVALARRTVRAG